MMSQVVSAEKGGVEAEISHTQRLKTWTNKNQTICICITIRDESKMSLFCDLGQQNNKGCNVL